MKKEKLRLAIAGAGTWANMAHLPGLVTCPYVELVAICDRDRHLAERAAAQFSIPKVYKDYDEMLLHEELDMVDICTSNREHYPMSKKAMEAGLNVLCEKPIGLNLKEAYSLYKIAKYKRVQTAVGFTFRHSPALKRMKQLIDDGYVGEIWNVQGFEQNSLFHDPQVEKPKSWVDKKADVGALGGFGSHLVDLVHYCVGDFKEVIGDMRNFVPYRKVVGQNEMARCEVDDSTMFMGIMENGAQGVFQVSWLAAGRPPGVELRVFGDKGSLWVRLNEHPKNNEWLMGNTIEDGILHPIEIPGQSEKIVMDQWAPVYYSSLINSVTKSFLEENPIQGDFQDGWRCQRVLEAISKSHKMKQWVQVDSL